MPYLATILVGLVVFGTFGAVIARGIYNKKHGKSGCSCGCRCEKKTCQWQVFSTGRGSCAAEGSLKERH